MANYCHLSYEERKNIEDGLNSNKFITEIAHEINRSHSTVLREISRNKVYYKPNNHGYCNITDPVNLYKYSHCEKLDKKPYVCNGCKSRSGCRKKDILIMLEKLMIPIKKLKVKLEKVLI